MPLIFHLHCLCTHHVSFVFQRRIVIHGKTAHFGGRFHTSRHLLCHVPCLVRKVPFLTRCHVDVRSLCVGQCLYGGRLVGIVMHPHVIHREAGQLLDAGFQAVRHARLVFLLYRLLEFALQGIFLLLCTLHRVYKSSLKGVLILIAHPLQELIGGAVVHKLQGAAPFLFLLEGTRRLFLIYFFCFHTSMFIGLLFFHVVIYCH